FTPSPAVVPRQPRASTPTPFFLPPTPAAAPVFPAWVAEFSAPILSDLAARQPNFQDDFHDFSKGWFYFIPESPRGPYYAHIEDETLLLKLPAENEKRDYWVYNPRLLAKNFALRFEFRFLESQPEDTVRFQFDESSQRGAALDLSKSQTWTLRWGPYADWRSLEGAYAHFPPDPIEVLTIVKGLECAFYLNRTPLAYLPDCRAAPTLRSAPWALTFRILAEPGHTASAAIDELKFWDLSSNP
ncbi:MAG: hypothetical protein LDL51_12410, partial [Chloroflexi bacterium]|nr:hypothetical protein [Chloroflexota bacterium]